MLTRQAAKEMSDGGTLAARLCEISRFQVRIRDDDAPIGRNDIHMIGFHRHPSGHLTGGHLGMLLQELCQMTFITGVKVRNDHECHAGIR